MAIPTIPLGPRTRKIVRYGGIVLAAFITFIFALQLSLPLERAKGKLIETLSPNYDVTIGDMEHGIIPGRVYLDAVTIRTRPTKADDQVTTFYIERLRVDVGLLALIGGNLSIDIKAKIATGTISGNITLPGFGKRGLELHIEGSDLPSASLPVRALAGLPMSGKLDFEVALDIPNETTKTHAGANWQKAEGFVELECPSGCVFGDGKTKLKPLLKNTGQQAMVGEGIEFGTLKIDSLLARVEIKNGSLDVTKFDAKSPDGELHVDYSMKLEPAFEDSMVTGCLRFNISDTLHKREPTTWAALINTGAERRNDGLFHIKLSDHFKSMLRLNLECGPNAKPDAPMPHIVPPHPALRGGLPPTAPPEPPKPNIPAVPPPAPPTPPGGSAAAGSAAGQLEGNARPGEAAHGGEGARGGEGKAEGEGAQGSEGSGSAEGSAQPQMQ
jgi:type II secretion system protein N